MKTNFVNMMTRTQDKVLDRGIVLAMILMALASYILMPQMQAKILCSTLFLCGALMELAMISKRWPKTFFFISFAVFAIGVILSGF